jgi:hypothetical protein
LKPYGLDTPTATATVGAGSTRATLLVGSAVTGEGKSGVYARDASRPMVFVVPKDVADELQKGLNDYRRKDVFEFRPYNAKRLDITRGSDTFVFEKVKGSGKDATEKWRRTSPRPGDVDATKMDSLLSKLSNLRAQSFADAKTQTGLNNPALTVKAVFDENNRREEVKFGRTAGDVYAGRSDEPGAMKLDTKEFDEALQALDALK